MYNYGGFLQELAVQDAIFQIANNCEIINYSPAQEAYTFGGESFFEKLTFQRVTNKLRTILQSNATKERIAIVDKTRKRAIDCYREKYLCLSASMSYGDLRGKRLPYDTLVCGSDQIWNPNFNIPSYFLDFAKEILLFKMASAMVFPVLMTVSTVDKSVSKASR